MNKINNIDAIAKSYSSQNNNKITNEKAPKETSNNTEAIISHTKPSLNANSIDKAASQILDQAKNNAEKALEASTSQLDEARIKALLED